MAAGLGDLRHQELANLRTEQRQLIEAEPLEVPGRLNFAEKVTAQGREVYRSWAAPLVTSRCGTPPSAPDHCYDFKAPAMRPLMKKRPSSAYTMRVGRDASSALAIAWLKG